MHERPFKEVRGSSNQRVLGVINFTEEEEDRRGPVGPWMHKAIQYPPPVRVDMDARRRLIVAFKELVAIVMASVLYNRIPLDRSGDHREASYIISGSFASSSLYVLRYERASCTLAVVQSVPGLGPHQYLHIDRLTPQRVYATSWTAPHITAWAIDGDHPGSGGAPRLRLINQSPITAISSYITSKHSLLFSVGGPTGEVHQLMPETGAIEEKLQEILFVPKEALDQEDKSHRALRYGSHGIEVSSLGQVFVPHLGLNSIWIYNFDPHTKSLEFLTEVKSLQPDDGPRHAVVSEDGKRLYVVTEHTSRVDLYDVTRQAILHRASSFVIEEPQEHSKYRGDTVRIVPSYLTDSSPKSREYIFATTRGTGASQPGHLAVFLFDVEKQTLTNVLRWETPTSGGKANAIEFSPVKSETNKLELVLTDDELGWVSVLEYDLLHNSIRVVATCLLDQINIGASHAVWI
ncbi:hypothetical protein PCANC_06137 [Puccinia coronata f. sp. avenae]|uniref:Muconate cycloisomerase 1 n=1 Tax=Puccinia coronata f. sp. avenae TaxID=200324 RepID=A0A2N5V991_9BASI|nr:hypothetical protein PCASD_07381 [Puccinia coronata f. sp. avenae]PLW53383.1 hypothetical protein PCANC_06137 [Puccinia coronata f. sp. avenae]